MGEVAIHWFRKGLRLHDNAGLLKAAKSCSTLIPLYILDTEYLDPKKVGVNRMGFLLDSLKCLDEDLREKGSCLFVAKGKPLEIMDSLIKEFNVKTLTFERDTEPYNKALDEEMTKMAETKHQVEVHSFWGHTLFDPEYLLELNNGKAPLTMTSFLNIASEACNPSKPADAPISLPASPIDFKSKQVDVFSKIPTLSDLAEYGYVPEEKTTWFVAGEKEAIKRMEDFLVQKKRVTTFEKPKTDPTSLVPDSTALSPYISMGSLSVRLFYAKLKEVIASTAHTEPPVSLEGQLYWRELAYLIGFSTPNFNQMLGNPICMQIPWLEGEAAKPLVDNWEKGQTGYPAVDAAMNQLKTDGWMHHLARHLVACFLTRGDLWVTWEMGRDVFEKYLVDADWSINNFSWHWLSCSAFFHEYETEYGPTTFFEKTDPTGQYIRKHVPILKEYPDKYIYEPWTAPRDVQEAAGCVIGKDYPEPMVDHKVVHKDNMGKMKKAYEG